MNQLLAKISMPALNQSQMLSLDIIISMVEKMIASSHLTKQQGISTEKSWHLENQLENRLAFAMGKLQHSLICITSHLQPETSKTLTTATLS